MVTPKTTASTQVERWSRLKPLLADALELAPDERADFVARVAAGDAGLGRELAELIAAGEQRDTPMDGAAVLEARALIDAQSTQAWIGRRLGPWRLLSLIGRGGMGHVYLAERADGQYEQQVAVKLMRDGLDVDAAALVARFRAERQILASLDHPNLAKILDAGLSDEGVPYFVMELVRGGSIDAWCTARALPLRDRVSLFRQVCLVVNYAHQHGVVHRDLKPSNILVTEDGVVKLVDFGIARRVVQDADPSRTATLQQAMTLEYASPEQVRGGHATVASDLFSLGVVLYRLLAGTGPYPAALVPTGFELAQAICETEAEPPSRVAKARTLRRQLRGDLDAVVLKALRKDPRHRYPSAEAMADDLFRTLEGFPVAARRGAWSYRVGRFLLRHKLGVAAALAANLALVAGLGVAAYEGMQASQQRERAQRHFDSVRRLAHAVLFDAYHSLERVPGSLDARRQLVATALGYLKELNAEARDDPSLQIEVANAYSSIGDIQGGASAASLGDTKAALASFDAGLALVRPLMVRTDPLRDKAASEFVTLSHRKGTLLMAQGRWKEAETLEREGLAVVKALVAAAPTDFDLRKKLASQSGALMLMYLRNGDPKAFPEIFAEHLAEEEALHALRPDDPDIVADLGTAHTARAVHLMQNVATPEAMRESLEEYGKALAIMEPAYARNRVHFILAGNYARTHDYMGHLLAQMGRPREAEPHLRRAIEVITILVNLDPNEVRSRTEQAEAHGRLGEVLMDLHDPAGAAAQAQASLAAFDALPASMRQEVTIEFNRAATMHMLGEALDAQGDRAAACGRFREAAALMADDFSRRPVTPMTQGMKDKTEASAARCAAAAGAVRQR